MFTMDGSIIKVDDKLMFVVTEYKSADNRIVVSQEKYEIMDSEQSKLYHGQQVEADIIWHHGKEYAVVKSHSFKDTYSPQDKADELVGYFRNYRFYIGIVDAKIMALRIADEMLKNPAIKDDGFNWKDNSNIEYKSFWREVKRIIKQQPVSDNDELTKPTRNTSYGF